MAGKKCQGLATFSRGQHPVAMCLQVPPCDVANEDLVVDHQDQLAGAGSDSPRPPLRRANLEGCRRGQVDLEARPLADLAGDLNETPMSLDDSQHRRQSQSRSLAEVLRGEEGVENLVD